MYVPELFYPYLRDRATAVYDTKTDTTVFIPFVKYINIKGKVVLVISAPMIVLFDQW